MEKGNNPGEVLLTRQEFGDCLNIVEEAISGEASENVHQFLSDIGVDFNSGEVLPIENGMIAIDEEGIRTLVGSMAFDQMQAEEEIDVAKSERDFERSTAISEATVFQKSLLQALLKLSPDAIEIMDAIRDIKDE